MSKVDTEIDAHISARADGKAKRLESQAKRPESQAKRPERQAKRPERIYAFIDSQNLNVSTQKFGWKMDWRKFRKFLEDKYGVTKAYMFIGYLPENESLYEQMHESGYAVVLKPTYDMTKPRPESQISQTAQTSHLSQIDSIASHADLATATAAAKPVEKKPVKGNIDAELVLWAMKEMSNYDRAIIVSGDGDFYCLVEYLEAKGRLLHVLTPTAHYSGLYNRYDDYVVRLDTFKRELRYYDFRKKK